VLVPDTVNVATLQPPAGAGNVVTVLVPGLTEIFAVPGALMITIPDPPDLPSDAVPLGGALEGGLLLPPPPPPPPVLAVPATARRELQPNPPP
jgi:hypothetical protein